MCFGDASRAIREKCCSSERKAYTMRRPSSGRTAQWRWRWVGLIGSCDLRVDDRGEEAEAEVAVDGVLLECLM